MSDFSRYFPEQGGAVSARQDFSNYFPPAASEDMSGSLVDRIPRDSEDIKGKLLQSAKSGMRFYTPLDVGEAALSMGSAAIGGVVGSAAGVGRTLTGGKFGTQAGIQQGQETARDVMEAMTFRPRREGAQEITRQIGGALSASKLGGIGPTEAISLAPMAGPALRQISDRVRSVPIPQMRGTTPEMAGFGAAETRPEALRIERAAQLPVPIKLTKGQATRTFEQQQFEREAAKNPVIGEPLRQRFAEQNKQIPQNLEFFADQTGAEAGSIRATGEIVTEAITSKAKSLKGRIDAAYIAAREAGEMQAPINISPLKAYLESNRSQFITADILPATLDDISAQAKAKGGIVTINDIENVRRNVGIAGGKDATNAHYARELREIIDNISEGVGGDKYKYARRLRAQYAKEFENVGIIDRLMSTRPGTRDRAIAFEDVFDRSIMGGSLDDVRAVRRTLQTAGPQGQQAWKELQGQTLNHLRDEITKNSARDIYGNPVVSAAQFNKIVTALEKDGKLEFIFGKQGAQKIRDVRDLSLDVLTSPPGSVNTSNTASVLAAMLDTVAMMTTGIPAPVATLGKLGFSAAKEAKQRNLVNEALNPKGIFRP